LGTNRKPTDQFLLVNNTNLILARTISKLSRIYTVGFRRGTFL